MTSPENNGRLDIFRFNVNLLASEGAEGVPHGQGWVTLAGGTQAATAGRPWPMGGPPGLPFGVHVPSIE